MPTLLSETAIEFLEGGDGFDIYLHIMFAL